MHKLQYILIGLIPIAGPIIQRKTNFFAFKCSPFMAEFTKTAEYPILTAWLKKHPNQILSPKMAAKLIEKTTHHK